MKNKIKGQLFIAAFMGAFSIILGAFSAHGLEAYVNSGILSRHNLEVFEKGVKYQMNGAIVLLILSLINRLQLNIIFLWSFRLLVAGIICFSGSLYFIALQNLIHIFFPRFLFWITPLGGFLMIVAWIMIFIEGGKSLVS